MVIHTRHHIFQRRVSQNIPNQCSGQSHGYRKHDVVCNQFSAGVAGCKQSPDGFCFLFNSASRRNGKCKGQHRGDDIQEPLEHDFIASHIFTGKLYRLIVLTGNKFL